MKTFSFFLLFIVSVAVHGQEIKPAFDGHTWKAPYTFIIPEGWTIERFLIPISFAPQITYTGVEDVRFAPGWAKPKSDDYWSYAFLWYLDGKIKMNSKIIEQNLKAYYTGLVSINGRDIPKEKLIPVTSSFKVVQKDIGDVKTFAGIIKMVDYMSQKPISLNCKAHWKYCPAENKTLVYYELSPKPTSHAIWLTLDKLWDEFNCKIK